MRARRGLAAVLLLGTLAGCGIEPTEVIEFGQPATGVKRPGGPGWQARLYFAAVSDVIGVPRPADGPVGAEDAVRLLLDGPNEAEGIRGLYSEVPRKPGPGTDVVVTTGQGRVDIRLPVDVTGLTRIARNQLVCTAAHNEVPGAVPWNRVKVTLSGGGKKLNGLECDRL
ncbi:GerMN domain-containing protein [Streptomyces sp. I05A-00742]|uniref:GerMN domain-containing protein n=1 Tax=Streptomyces sp. I05A-00742 TaxID=2732853 RepID=UPI00148985BB|nr:GerMN domain-containing protein [Streptomyces sp. I05A-00742]